MFQNILVNVEVMEEILNLAKEKAVDSLRRTDITVTDEEIVHISKCIVEIENMRNQLNEVDYDENYELIDCEEYEFSEEKEDEIFDNQIKVKKDNYEDFDIRM